MKPYFQDNSVTIWHGDCREIVPTLGKFDLLLTDPPYGIGAAAGKDKSRGIRIGFRGNGSALVYTRVYGDDDWDNSPPPAEVLDMAIKTAKFSTIFGGNYFGLPASSCWLIWDKDNGANNFADCEIAWTNFKTAVRKFTWRWNGMLQENMANKEVRFHPTQKPLPVMKWAIEHADRASKMRIETILDPFAGSGTTGRAAKDLGRKCTLIEREEKYCEIAARRMEQEVLALYSSWSKDVRKLPQGSIYPQPGPQTRILQCKADIAVYGGAAGGGKTYAALLEPLYHTHTKGFAAVALRKTLPMHKDPGGLWHRSFDVYPYINSAIKPQPNETRLDWTFPGGSIVKFGSMEHEKDKQRYGSSELPLVLFDEGCDFTYAQFWFMFSRLRSMSGVPGYVRVYTNPDADSWLRKFIDWWIGPDGFPLPKRDGVPRWFVRQGDNFVWAFTAEELKERFPGEEPKSVTFIKSNVYDNKILLEKDPTYLSNLKALPLVDRQRLLDGNWNVRAAAGDFFKMAWFGNFVKAVPEEYVTEEVRFWDRASSQQMEGKDPDATFGLRMAKARKPAPYLYYIRHCVKKYDTPLSVNRTMLRYAKSDGRNIPVCFATDPASAGDYEAQDTTRYFDGYWVRTEKFGRTQGDKQARAKPVSSQVEAGNVAIVDDGSWEGTSPEEFCRVLENFPIGSHDDEVDGLAGAYYFLNNQGGSISSSGQVDTGQDNVRSWGGGKHWEARHWPGVRHWPGRGT